MTRRLIRVRRTATERYHMLSTVRIQAEAQLWLIVVEATLRRTVAVLVPDLLMTGEGQTFWVRTGEKAVQDLGLCESRQYRARDPRAFRIPTSTEAAHTAPPAGQYVSNRSSVYRWICIEYDVGGSLPVIFYFLFKKSLRRVRHHLSAVRILDYIYSLVVVYRHVIQVASFVLHGARSSEQPRTRVTSTLS